MKAELLVEFEKLEEIAKCLRQIAGEMQSLRGGLYDVRMRMQSNEACAQLLCAEADRLSSSAERARTLASRVMDTLYAFDECDRRIQQRIREIACEEVLYEAPKDFSNRSS